MIWNPLKAWRIRQRENVLHKIVELDVRIVSLRRQKRAFADLLCERKRLQNCLLELEVAPWPTLLKRIRLY